MFACCFSTAVFNGAVKATRDNGVRARIYTTRVQLLRQRWNEAIAAGSSHARDGTGILIRLHTSATTFTTSLNILCILPTQCIQARHVILTFNRYGRWSFPVYVIKAHGELEVALQSFLILTLEADGKFTFHSQLNRGLCVCPRAGQGVWEEETLLLRLGIERFLGFPVLAQSLQWLIYPDSPVTNTLTLNSIKWLVFAIAAYLL
jgi:hypothetical protein